MAAAAADRIRNVELATDGTARIAELPQLIALAKPRHSNIILVGCVAQLAECRSLAGELTLSCARPAADG